MTGKLSDYIKATAQEEFKLFEQNINRLTIKLSFTIIIHLTQTLSSSSIGPQSSGRPPGRLQNNALVSDGPLLWADPSSRHQWPSSSPECLDSGKGHPCTFNAHRSLCSIDSRHHIDKLLHQTEIATRRRLGWPQLDYNILHGSARYPMKFGPLGHLFIKQQRAL